jgi:hypothetical protein
MNLIFFFSARLNKNEQGNFLMAVSYKKTKECYGWLFKELIRVLEGVEQSEIKKSLDELPDIFSINDLKTILSKNYILYEGFVLYMQKKLRPFWEANKADNTLPLREKLTQAKENPDEDHPDPGFEETLGLEPEVNSTVKISNANEPKSQPKVTGARLTGKEIENFKNNLEKKLTNFENVSTINFNADYQVDLYAAHITDDLHKSVEQIKDEMMGRFPGIKLKINVRPDRRIKEKE